MVYYLSILKYYHLVDERSLLNRKEFIKKYLDYMLSKQRKIHFNIKFSLNNKISSQIYIKTKKMFPVPIGKIETIKKEDQLFLVKIFSSLKGKDIRDILKQAYGKFVKIIPDIYYVNNIRILNFFFEKKLKEVLEDYNLYIGKIDFKFYSRITKSVSHKSEKEYISRYGKCYTYDQILDIKNNLQKEAEGKVIIHLLSIVDSLNKPLLIYSIKRGLITITDYGENRYRDVIENIINILFDIAKNIEILQTDKIRINNRLADDDYYYYRAVGGTFDVSYDMFREIYREIVLPTKQNILKTIPITLSNPVSRYISIDKEGRRDSILIRKLDNSVQISVRPLNILRNYVSPVVIDSIMETIDIVVNNIW